MIEVELFVGMKLDKASAAITASMYKRFCPHGEDIADAVMNFRFKKED